MYVCVCVYVCMYVCVYVCMYVCTYVCMYVRMYVCMYVRMYVCMYVRMYVCMYVCTYVRTYVCMYVCMYVCTYVCICVCTYIYIKWKLACLSFKLNKFWALIAEDGGCQPNHVEAKTAYIYIQSICACCWFLIIRRARPSYTPTQNSRQHLVWYNLIFLDSNLQMLL
jgi:hypothetical protein